MYSIKPQHTMNILNKDKVLEIRKTCPKEWKDYLSGKTKVKPESMKCLIYCTKGQPYLIDRRYNEHCQFNYDLIDYYMAKYDEDAINGKVVAEFILKEVDMLVYHQEGRFDTWNFKDRDALDKCLKDSCLSMEEIVDYIGDSKDAFALHISDLKIYDEPKELSEFSYLIPNNKCEKHEKGLPCDKCDTFNKEHTVCMACYYIFRPMKQPPQSWCYVEEL